MNFLKLLEGIRTPVLDQLFQFITYFGQELIIIAVICVLYWCANKRFAYLLGFSYFSAGLCVQTLKITFRIPRPWVLDPGFHAVESAIPGATGYSFPSGHTQGATCLFAPISFSTKHIWMKGLCVLAFLSIGFSRLYLGCHTPKDVLVSLGISLFLSWLVWRGQHFLLDDTKYIKWIAAALTLASIGVSLYALFLLNDNIITQKYASDCCKAAGAGLGFAVGWYIERTCINFNTHTRTLIGQVLKLVLGLSIALGIKIGFQTLFGGSILSKMVQYFLLVLWVLAIYPYCFSKFQKK
ncbi:MAG: phosphatase PAP2 family protein [Lachnospiraceae bacterium]